MKEFVIGLTAVCAVGIVFVLVIFTLNTLEANHKKDLATLIRDCLENSELSLAKNLAEGALLRYPADVRFRSLHAQIIEQIKRQTDAAIAEKRVEIQNEKPEAKHEDSTMELKQELKALSHKLDRYIALSRKASAYQPPPVNQKNEAALIPPETRNQREHSLTVAIKEAIMAFDKGDTATAHKLFAEILKLDEQNPQANTYLAACLFKEDPDTTGNKKLIIKLCQTALKIDNAIEAAHFLLARSYQSQGQIDLSIQEYKQTLALNPENAEAYYLLGKVLFAKGAYTEATGLLLTALQLTPDGTDALYYLALCCEKQGDTAEAKKYLNKICESDKAFFAAFQKLGDICLTGKEYESALAAYLGANRINPNGQSLSGAARACRGLNKLHEARAYYLDAFKLNNTNPALISELMELLVKLNDFSKAAEISESLSPATSRLWYLTGFALYKTNQIRKAENALLEAVTLEADNYDAIYALCELYLSQNKKTEAGKFFAILLENDPSCKSEELLMLKKKMEEK